ncbi:hypothetical protein GQ457_05G033830 [Hibiscus cannabinus]
MHYEEPTKALSLSPIVDRFDSLWMAGKTGSVAVIQYQLVDAAIKNFREGNVLGEGGRLRTKGNHACRHRHLVSAQNGSLESQLYGINYKLFLLFKWKMLKFIKLVLDIIGPTRGSALTWQLRMKIAIDLFGTKLTDKSGVYGSGIILLEFLIGKKSPKEMSSTRCQSLLTDKSKLPNIVDLVISDAMDLKHLYQPLITDVLHSRVPLVPMELRGSLRVT